MPTYEYECKSCGHTFETFQAMSDEPLKSCPECGKEVRRLIFGGTGVIFKGSGFYVTDKSKGTAAAKTSKPADAAPADKSGSGTEKSAVSGTAAAESAVKKSAAAGSDASAKTA